MRISYEKLVAKLGGPCSNFEFEREMSEQLGLEAMAGERDSRLMAHLRRLVVDFSCHYNIMAVPRVLRLAPEVADARDRYGHNFLHLAVQCGVVPLVADYVTKVHLLGVSRNGSTPFDLTYSCGLAAWRPEWLTPEVMLKDRPFGGKKGKALRACFNSPEFFEKNFRFIPETSLTEEFLSAQNTYGRSVRELARTHKLEKLLRGR